MQLPLLPASSGLPSGLAPPAHCTPPRIILLPPPQVTMLAGRTAAVEGLSAPPLHRPPRRCAGCPGVYSCLLQQGLAEFSVGEAHQAAAVTAGPAYGSHLRGVEGQIGARWSGSRGNGERRNARCQRRPKSTRTTPSALLETPDAAAELPSLLQKPAPAHRACAVSSPPPPPQPACAARLYCSVRANEWRSRGCEPTVCGRPNRACSCRFAKPQTQ